MTNDFFRATYDTHPFYQCLARLGIRVDTNWQQQLSLSPSVLVHEALAHLLTSLGVAFVPTALQDETDLEQILPPCILHWNLNHFVLVTEINEAGLLIWDPYLGERRYSSMEFFDLCQKPGYINYAISLVELAPCTASSSGSPLPAVLKQEKFEERVLLRTLTSLAFGLSYLGKQTTRAVLHGVATLWDKLASPRIFSGPQRNYQQFLAMDPQQARRVARKNIAELAINMGYTGYLLHKLKTPRSTAWADHVIATPVASGSATFEGQCIVELMHLFDPISAVYSTIKQLPPGRDFVVYGNPWDDNMIALCEKAFREQGRRLEILPPAGKSSFLKLMKRARAGAHIIMFADGNPLFASGDATGLQLAHSFAPCKLWRHKAHFTLTGAMLAQKASANLYVAGLVARPQNGLAVHRIALDVPNRETVMQHKADAVAALLESSPHGWLFWRNAEVYFHEYKSVLETA
ncbi:cysteine peptidase family C39 domain-containing protein [Vibrio coralliilyticus]|uniref:cysteine peptidase family C39 domain-containing protein n=1 Tax=Vibrio coralliilyticus TaxID=190893 RepID=UPI002408FDB8|nr:cysteine peptidase family C39 domain-containing protein [Vibrio coralliilyticus]WFB50966.1 cysteine peptidase family C39 domain-containing protein [Vibrio coralliilyticus]